MKKIGLVFAGIFAALLFTYGALAALVNQGLSLAAAVLVFVGIVIGGIAIVKLLGNKPDSSSDYDP